MKSYIRTSQAWYARATRSSWPASQVEEVIVDTDDEDIAEITFTFHDLGPHTGTCGQVKLFDDAWLAFERYPELFKGLSERDGRGSVREVVTMLDMLGFKDETPRQQPDGPAPRCESCGQEIQA